MIRTIKALKSVFFIALLSVLAGCVAEVQIVSPANDTVSNEAPEFRLRFRDDVPETFTATLNGTEIPSSSFTIEDKDAFVQIDMNQLQAGDNVFSITDPSNVSTTFHLDAVGPVIHVLGAQGNDPKNVTGYLADRGGAASLTINGADIALNEDGSFAADVADATIFDLVATDVYGFASTESFIKLGETFDPAIAARINQQGLNDSLPNAILQIVESLDFNTFITNPVSESCSGAVIADACGNFNINDITLTPGTTVSIQALSGNKLRIAIGLSRLDLDTTATTFARCKSFLCGGSGTVFGTLNFSGVTTVRNTDIAGDFVITVDNGNVSVAIEGGSLDVDLPLNGLSVDIDFGAVEDVPFVGSLLNTVVNGIINGLLGVISSIVVNIVDGFLAGPISSLINGLVSDILPDSISVPVADTNLNLGFSPEGFSTSNGGFDLILANNVTIDAVDPEVLPPLGSAYAPGSAPNPYPTTTPNGTGVDLTATVSVNLINQILTEAYKGGLLNITLDESTGLTIGSLTSIDDFPIDLVGVTDFNIKLSGVVPPAVSVLPQAQSADGVIFVSLLDLSISVNADFGDDNGMQEILATTIDLRAPFDIGVSADSTLTIGIEGTPEVDVNSFRFQLGGLVLNEGGDGVVTNLVNTLVPQVLPEVLGSIGGIPVPSIAGFTLQLAGIWNPNANNEAFIALGGNLVSAEAAAAAVAPTVSADVAAKAFSLFSTETQADKRSATISVGGDNPTDEPLEYRYRVNGGHWTVWKQRDNIELSYLPAGDNVVEVCSRTHLLKEDCTDVTVSVPEA